MLVRTLCLGFYNRVLQGGGFMGVGTQGTFGKLRAHYKVVGGIREPWVA